MISFRRIFCVEAFNKLKVKHFAHHVPHPEYNPNKMSCKYMININNSIALATIDTDSVNDIDCSYISILTDGKSFEYCKYRSVADMLDLVMYNGCTDGVSIRCVNTNDKYLYDHLYNNNIFYVDEGMYSKTLSMSKEYNTNTDYMFSGDVFELVIVN